MKSNWQRQEDDPSDCLAKGLQLGPISFLQIPLSYDGYSIVKEPDGLADPNKQREQSEFT